MRNAAGQLVLLAIVLSGCSGAVESDLKQPAGASPPSLAPAASPPVPIAVVADEKSDREDRARERHAAELERKLILLETELTKAREEIRNTSEQRTMGAIESIQRSPESDQIRQLEETITSQRAQVGDMQLKILELTGNVADLSVPLAAVRKECDDLRAENLRLKQAAAGKVFAADPKLQGVVTAATREVLVEIGLGSDDGVRRGMTFDVTREGNPVGRIQILNASPHASIGKELSEFKQAEIEKNDEVANKPDRVADQPE